MSKYNIEVGDAYVPIETGFATIESLDLSDDFIDMLFRYDRRILKELLINHISFRLTPYPNSGMDKVIFPDNEIVSGTWIPTIRVYGGSMTLHIADENDEGIYGEWDIMITPKE